MSVGRGNGRTAVLVCPHGGSLSFMGSQGGYRDGTRQRDHLHRSARAVFSRSAVGDALVQCGASVARAAACPQRAPPGPRRPTPPRPPRHTTELTARIGDLGEQSTAIKAEGTEL